MQPSTCCNTAYAKTMCYAHKTFLLCKLYITQGVGVRLHLQSQLIFIVRLAFPHIVVFFRHSGQVILAPPPAMMSCCVTAFWLAYLPLSPDFSLHSKKNICTVTLYLLQASVLSFMDSLLSLTSKTDVPSPHNRAIVCDTDSHPSVETLVLPRILSK